MKLLEELKQRTIEKKTLKEYEETSKVYLEKWYEEYSKQLRSAADNGFDYYVIDIKDDYNCTSYIMNKFKEDGLIISDVSKYAPVSNTYERFGYTNNGTTFKVSW